MHYNAPQRRWIGVVQVARNMTRNRLTRREVLRYGAYTGLGAGLLGSLPLGGCRNSRGEKRPNILLITLDTTRRDRLGCYGCARATSPNLDALAGESVVYDQATAPSNWTLPSHASLFTGKFTTSHGARYDAEGPLCLKGHLAGPDTFWSHFRARGLSPDEVTLASMLRQAGYATAAVAAGPWLKRAFGLDKGFQFYDDSQISTLNGRRAAQVTYAALEWLRQLRDETFFVFVNYFDPHEPYRPPGGFARRFLRPGTRINGNDTSDLAIREQRDLYDAEVLYMDYHIGHLINELKRMARYDSTWIIVASDHGEMLGEHARVGHGHRLYQQEIHIPMFVKYPKGEIAPSRTSVPVQLTDVMPMILHRLGTSPPADIQGGLPPSVGHPIVAEIYPLEFLRDDGNSRAILEDNFKYVWNAKGSHALYNLADDPHEQTNLLDDQAERARAMDGRLNTYLASLPRPDESGPPQIVDEQTQRALRSLGYTE